MKGDWPDDTFTENDVLRALESSDLRYKNGQRYILSQCPLHEDKNPSVQIYKDDWFVNCHSGCGRFHITKAYPELRKQANVQLRPRPDNRRAEEERRTVMEHKYIAVDLMDFWEKLSEIPQDHLFKGIPIEVLHDLGWRYDDQKNRYFIPYFSASRTSIPFAQWRNLGSPTDSLNPRFNFWKDAKPTCYGTWNLDNSKLFVVEGTSDCAVLEYAAVPWIGLPSAASSTLMVSMANYCKENGIQLIYAGDNDSAGDKLREALEDVMPYRTCQPPKDHKDWGDFLEKDGLESVQQYCFAELFPDNLAVSSVVHEANKPVDIVKNVFPGAQELEIVVDPEENIVRSNISDTEPTPLF